MMLYNKKATASSGNRLDYHSHDVTLQPRRVFRARINVIVLHNLPLKMVNLMCHAVEPLFYRRCFAYTHKTHAEVWVAVCETLVRAEYDITGAFYLSYNTIFIFVKFIHLL